MADEQKRDPLEGFQTKDYDPDSKFVTIQIDRRLLANARQREAIAKKCVEIISYGEGVNGVKIQPRS